MDIWLVEIRLKDWIHSKDSLRVVAYEEVIASGELDARFKGYDQFKERAKYVPILKRKLMTLGITPQDCCAPDAVCLEEVK